MYGQKSVLRREYAFFMERKWKMMTIEDKDLFLNIDKQKTDSTIIRAESVFVVLFVKTMSRMFCWSDVVV